MHVFYLSCCSRMSFTYAVVHACLLPIGCCSCMSFTNAVVLACILPTLLFLHVFYLHCYKTECWFPLHSKDVSGLKSSWHEKCFLLLDRVNTCSRMDSSNHNGKLHWKILTQTGIFHDYPSPRWSFPMIPPKKVFFRWCSLH